METPETALPRRVLMTADGVGGVFTYALELARAYERYGIEVLLAVMGGPLNRDQWREIGRHPNIRAFEGHYRLEWMRDPWDDVRRAGEWLLKLASDLSPDLVHLNGYAHGNLDWRAPVLVAAHSCVYSWFAAVKGENPPSEEWAPYRMAVIQGLKAADAVTAPTFAMLSALQHHYGAFNTAPAIHNGRDPEAYGPGEKRPIVLAAGRLWDEAKNIGALDRIAPDLPWPVYVAGAEHHPEGGGTGFPHLRRLGLLSGRNLAGWYAGAPIFALPARYEPFGLTPLEAALSGSALVLGDIDSLKEVWGGDALFVPPEDDGALKEALMSLIEDPDRRAAMAAKARKRAKRYTPARMANGYLDLYRHMRNKGTRPHVPKTVNPPRATRQPETRNPHLMDPLR